jgi:hypothetical protein
MIDLRPAALSSVSLLALGLLACTGAVGETLSLEPRSGEPGTTLAAPLRATFEPVHDVLEPTCGTLDCHGQVGRNMRLYGGRGLRLRKTDNPADDPTTPEEYEHSYWAVIGLEPAVMSDVVLDGGREPERLTLVRKARNLEHHKGGKLFTAGDDRDRCLTSWLAGQLDLPACTRGKELLRPGAKPEPTEP